MRALQWIRVHDPALAALRRAARAAVVIPPVFAFGTEVVGDPQIATFAAFGSFAMILLVEFGGPMRERLQAQLALAAVGACLICVGTLCSRSTMLAAVSMGLVAFAVLFAGVVSSVLASASTALLLTFILPVSLPADPSDIVTRLEGFGIATVAALFAISVLWPAPVRDPLRAVAIAASRAVAERLRADGDWILAGCDAAHAEQHAEAVHRGEEAVAALRRTFFATPYRPTGLTTAARTVVRLVDELLWVQAIVSQTVLHPQPSEANHGACHVKKAAAAVLDASAQLLEMPRADPAALDGALADLREQLARTERSTRLPVLPGDGERDLISARDPAFRAQELSFAVTQIAANAAYAAAAERRSWMQRVLGRQPEGVRGTLSAAQERAAAHVDRSSVWLHNSVRGAIGLAVAVAVAGLTNVDHSFWVILGALSVLRSNWLSTGQTVVQALAGTLLGFVAGALLVVVVGTNTTVLWVLLPIAILIAGFAPAAISFAAGQAAFTLLLVILFNIVQPTGWTVGLVRIEDVLLGCAVSLVVGVLFWPRGASTAMRQALAGAYRESARYAVSAVELAAAHERPGGPLAGGIAAAAASRRLDDAYRAYLAERGAKLMPLAGLTTLVSGVVNLRLAADAIVDLWQAAEAGTADEPALTELRAIAATRADWYAVFAQSLAGDWSVPAPQPRDTQSDVRLVQAAAGEPDGATAIRIVWTGDHLDAVRRLELALVDPAQAAEDARRRAARLRSLWPLRLSPLPQRG
jgi:hypothetical protein